MKLNTHFLFGALIGLIASFSDVNAQNSARGDMYSLPGFSKSEKSKSKSSFFSKAEPVQILRPEYSQFNFEPGYLYLRKKINATTYVLYKGKADPEQFRKLNALDLGNSKPQELLFKKLYRKTNKKPFEDELDIYFDSKGIYFEATPALYFKEKTTWQELSKSKVQSNIFSILTHPDKAEIRDENGALLGQTPLNIGSIVPGFHYFRIEKEGYLPLVLGTEVKSNETSSITQDLLFKSPSEDQPKPFDFFPVSSDSSHSYLDSSELHLRTSIEAHYSKVHFLDSLFNLSYYQLQQPNPEWADSTNALYSNYTKAFEKVRKISFESYAKNWLSRIDDLESNLKLISEAKDKKHAKLINLPVSAVIESFEPQSNNSYKIKLDLKGAQHWIQGKWEGIAIIDSTQSRTLDSLFKKKTTANLNVSLEDWPISFIGLDGQRQYRYYRLQTPTWNLGGKPAKLAGQWIFSPAMMSLPDVARFVRADSMNAIDQMNLKLEEEMKRQQEARKKAEKELQQLDQLVRGEVVELNGTEFEFKGKKVTLSAFALNSTEITQEHYARVTGTNPSTSFIAPQKPVFNVSWENAMAFCKEIGGSLPTEAQWEFAARAGTNSYYYWGERQMHGNGLSPEPWAVFDENSFKLGKPGPQEVASRRPNSFGFYDMAGNLQEWVYDAHAWWYGSTLMSRKDPKGPSSLIADDHRLKGGSWRSDKRELQHTKYDHEDPRFWSDDIGFRCAFPSHEQLHSDSLEAKLKLFSSRQPKEKESTAK